jgi:hypothetical protein
MENRMGGGGEEARCVGLGLEGGRRGSSDVEKI